MATINDVEIMRHIPLPILECVTATIIAGALWNGHRIIDCVVGLPGPDERLIIACYSPACGISFEQAIADGASVDWRNGEGATALMLASGFGQTDHVRQLLQKRADVNATDCMGRTPLMYAAMAGRSDVMQFLIAHGADTLRKDHFGMTAAQLLKTCDKP